ncbi:16S rRNA (guanine(527)-N(7))-methyltransferase RsmG [Maritalea mediterranea]|uniref:Ribosomal RNA small subunit methyltransferase G n=1 Tax=Maritalea mediterranea TaxID=2909667 RepID=A0ABS9E4U1_9HYPH|nr:16S rRNA (guanine(527)-N(7))-methyltransferase RsmG [Maritalea mediterranea]MCF4096914.1 16S rRNA (guanine(527)-N(7))-methyltransferase RsmG [Maritalea mediterranea]
MGSEQAAVATYLASLDAWAGNGEQVDSIVEHLLFYEASLIKWQKIKNLVSRETLSEIWSRHFLDCLQLIPMIRADSRTLVDFGSGGGFPAIPLAIALKQQNTTIHMVESNGRKGSFLRQMVRELDLNAKIHTERAESLNPKEIGPVDVFTARAFAPLTDILTHVSPFWQENSVGLFQKGRGYSKEIEESLQKWRYTYSTVISKTQNDAAIVQITDLEQF